MTKLDMLLIRACKTENPNKRLRSIYRRFYLNSKEYEFNLVGIMSKIVDEYCPITMIEYFRIKDEKKRQYDTCLAVHGEMPPEEWEQELNILINHIRFNFNNEHFKETGCKVPIIFRRKL